MLRLVPHRPAPGAGTRPLGDPTPPGPGARLWPGRSGSAPTTRAPGQAPTRVRSRTAWGSTTVRPPHAHGTTRTHGEGWIVRLGTPRNTAMRRLPSRRSAARCCCRGAAWRKVIAVPGMPAHLLDVTETGGLAGAVAAFARNIPLKPTASVVGRDYAAPGIGAGPSIRRLASAVSGPCRGLYGTDRHRGPGARP